MNTLLFCIRTVNLIGGKLNSRHSGLLRPDYSEKSQGRRTSRKSGNSAEVKVGVTAASEFQVKNPSKKPKSVESLKVFSDLKVIVQLVDGGLLSGVVLARSHPSSTLYFGIVILCTLINKAWFTYSAAGALPTIWAKLPQSLVLEGRRRVGGK